MISLQWTLFYLVPAMTGALFAFQQKTARGRLVVIHLALLVSTFLLAGIAGASLSFGSHAYVVIFLVASCVGTVLLLRR